MCWLTSGWRIWLSQRPLKAVKAEFREDSDKQPVGLALENVEVVMKESLLYIFSAARSSFEIIGGNASRSGTGPEGMCEMSSTADSHYPTVGTQAVGLPTFGQESSALFEKFDYLSKIYAMPRFQ